MTLSDRYDDAYLYARDLHSTQVRSEDQGGLRTLEDIRERFGRPVADIVADCTDAWTEPRPPWRARKEAYLEALPTKPAASLLVSLADKVHNAEAILFDHRATGDEVWTRFTVGADGTRWYYRALAKAFAELMPGRLADRLTRAVDGFAPGRGCEVSSGGERQIEEPKTWP